MPGPGCCAAAVRAKQPARRQMSASRHLAASAGGPLAEGCTASIVLMLGSDGLRSATMPTWVKKLSRQFQRQPLTVDLVGDEEAGKMAETIKCAKAPSASSLNVLDSQNYTKPVSVTGMGM